MKSDFECLICGIFSLFAVFSNIAVFTVKANIKNYIGIAIRFPAVIIYSDLK
ncbi:MAG: phage holin family protein [Lachnospiraceae bacterium]|nr:phage holin family protein [Lachnospiraceae bacterium]